MYNDSLKVNKYINHKEGTFNVLRHLVGALINSKCEFHIY